MILSNVSRTRGIQTMTDQSSAKRSIWASGRGWLIGGAALLFAAAAFAIHTAWFLNHSASATGTIVDLLDVLDAEDNSHTYAPVFRFTADGGTAYTITSHNSTNPPEFSIGEKVTVRYLPSNPAGARIQSFFQLWFVSAMFGSIGLAFLLTGYVLHRTARRKLRTATASPEPRTDA